LPVMTLESDLEHMLISMARQSGEEGLVIENSLAEQILKKIVQSNEELGAEGKQSVMVVSPAIRRVFSHFIRQHIDDQVVLAFTELPETRKIEVVATISNATQQ
jgi:flagellar biosynthesis protein FlhA